MVWLHHVPYKLQEFISTCPMCAVQPLPHSCRLVIRFCNMSGSNKRLAKVEECSRICACVRVCDYSPQVPQIIQCGRSARSAVCRSTHLRFACHSLTSCLSHVFQLSLQPLWWGEYKPSTSTRPLQSQNFAFLLSFRHCVEAP